MKKKNAWPDGITGEFYPKFKEEIIDVSFFHKNSFIKKKEEETLLNWFYEAKITLYKN